MRVTWRLMVNQLPEVPLIAAMKTKYLDNHWGSSVRKLPWDDRDTITPAEALISSTMNKWYEAKHRESSKDEIDISMCKEFEEVKVKIAEYIDYYNNERYQWDLAYLTPVEYYHYTMTGQYPLELKHLPKKK